VVDREGSFVRLVIIFIDFHHPSVSEPSFSVRCGAVPSRTVALPVSHPSTPRCEPESNLARFEESVFEYSIATELSILK
jgi:hypothetical protein